MAHVGVGHLQALVFQLGHLGTAVANVRVGWVKVAVVADGGFDLRVLKRHQLNSAIFSSHHYAIVALRLQLLGALLQSLAAPAFLFGFLGRRCHIRVTHCDIYGHDVSTNDSRLGAGIVGSIIRVAGEVKASA